MKPCTALQNNILYVINIIYIGSCPIKTFGSYQDVVIIMGENVGHLEKLTFRKLWTAVNASRTLNQAFDTSAFGTMV